MNSAQLKNLLIDDYQIEDLMLAKIDLQNLDQAFQEAKSETPEWVLDKLSVVSREITERNRINLEKRLKAARSRRAALATVSEQRKGLDNEIADLEKRLG